VEAEEDLWGLYGLPAMEFGQDTGISADGEGSGELPVPEAIKKRYLSSVRTSFCVLLLFGYLFHLRMNRCGYGDRYVTSTWQSLYGLRDVKLVVTHPLRYAQRVAKKSVRLCFVVGIVCRRVYSAKTA
jgi:hypothetical protein